MIFDLIKVKVGGFSTKSTARDWNLFHYVGDPSKCNKYTGGPRVDIHTAGKISVIIRYVSNKIR